MRKNKSAPLWSSYPMTDTALPYPGSYSQSIDSNHTMEKEPGSLLWWRQVVETSRLQEIQDRFAKIMRVGSIITTVDGDPITRPSHFSDFCLAMRTLPKNERRCFHSDATGGARALKAGRVILYRCPHGLLDMACPIIVENKHVGVLLCGQVRLSNYNEQQMDQIIEKYWEDVVLEKRPILKKLFLGTERVDRRLIRKAMDFLHLVTSHIVDMCERFITERDLLQRGITFAQIQRNKEAMERSIKQTQLKSLENQLNPHFMFNTLNIISRLALFENAPRTQELTVQFSEYLRYVLQQQSQRGLIPLEMEMDCIRRYLNIYQTRLGSRLQHRIEIEPSTNTCLVPFMFLQPLVENAILHGIEPLPQGGEIFIRSLKKGENLLIEINDNGTGFNSQAAPYGIGLNNVLQRIELYYNSRGHVHIDSTEGTGTRIRISIPLGNEVQNA